MDTQEFSIRPELYLFVRASKSIMAHDSSLNNDERDVLLTYVKTLADRYLVWQTIPRNETREVCDHMSALGVCLLADTCTLFCRLNSE